MEMQDRLLQIIKIVKAEFPDLLAIYLFGSQVAGETHNESDLDLALLFRSGDTPDALVIYHLPGKMVDIAGCSVDIGILRLDNVVFAKEVITKGRRIYCHDQRQCDEFAMYCLAYYGQLNFERAEILHSYEVSEK